MSPIPFNGDRTVHDASSPPSRARTSPAPLPLRASHGVHTSHSQRQRPQLPPLGVSSSSRARALPEASPSRPAPHSQKSEHIFFDDLTDGCFFSDHHAQRMRRIPTIYLLH